MTIISPRQPGRLLADEPSAPIGRTGFPKTARHGGHRAPDQALTGHAARDARAPGAASGGPLRLDPVGLTIELNLTVTRRHGLDVERPGTLEILEAAGPAHVAPHPVVQ